MIKIRPSSCLRGSYWVFMAVMFVLSSCSIIVKQYPANRPFVFKTNINIKGNLSNDTSEILQSKLKGQLDDSMRARSVSKLVVSVMKNPPAYETVNAEKSVVYMHALMNSLGYFRDSITFDTTMSFKGDQQRTTVNFNVKPGRVTRFDSIYYGLDTPLKHPNQKELQALAVRNPGESTLKKNEPFAKGAVSSELDRLTEIYRNNGYLKFTREMMIGLWDTVDVSLLRPTNDPFEELEILQKLKDKRNNPTANIELKMKPGFDTSRLRKYYVGRVTILPDFGTESGIDSARYDKNTYNKDSANAIIIYYRKIFKPWIFDNNTSLRRGELYNQSNFFKTINRFNSLGAWRLVNIDQLPRPDQDTADFTIKLIPARKYTFQANLEGSSNSNAVSGNLFGIAVNLGLLNRNFARAANQTNTNLRFGIEFGDSSLVQTRQFILSHEIYFPRAIPNFRFIKPKVRETFRSKFAFSAGNTERLDLYNLTTFNISFGYEFKVKNMSFNLRIPNIEYSNLVPRPLLETLFVNNPSLRNIFTDGLISSIAASMTATGGKNKNINVFRTNMEVSGLLSGFVRNKTLDDNLYKFIKIDAEFTRKMVFRKSVLAYRFFAGAGYELESTKNPLKRKNLPFFKQYFAGGPNSMRAWALRKLGPGSTVKAFSGPAGLFERYGDIQIETNLEWRFPLTTVSGVKLNGALFTDIGNVWLMKSAAGDPEQIFRFNKLGEDIAVGMGVGLRVDFDFFVVRFDFSHKVKDPSPSPTYQSLRNKWFGYAKDNFFRGTQFQLGISYPFIL